MNPEVLIRTGGQFKINRMRDQVVGRRECPEYSCVKNGTFRCPLIHDILRVYPSVKSFVTFIYCKPLRILQDMVKFCFHLSLHSLPGCVNGRKIVWVIHERTAFFFGAFFFFSSFLLLSISRLICTTVCTEVNPSAGVCMACLLYT